MLTLDCIHHGELNGRDLGKAISLEGLLYEADMEWDMIIGYDFMVDTSTGTLVAQSNMTLYRDDRLLWPSTTNHQVLSAFALHVGKVRVIGALHKFFSPS